MKLFKSVQAIYGGVYDAKKESAKQKTNANRTRKKDRLWR
jgi:hypothetical protein